MEGNDKQGSKTLKSFNQIDSDFSRSLSSVSIREKSVRFDESKVGCGKRKVSDDQIWIEFDQLLYSSRESGMDMRCFTCG